jgi:hypothetical protein
MLLAWRSGARIPIGVNIFFPSTKRTALLCGETIAVLMGTEVLFRSWWPILKVKNGWSCASTPPTCFHGLCSENFTTHLYKTGDILLFCGCPVAVHNLKILVLPNENSAARNLRWSAQVIYELKWPQPLPVNIIQIAFIHLFCHSIGRWRIRRFFVVLRSFFHSSLLYTFPATLLHQIFFRPSSRHLIIYFLFYLLILLIPNSYIVFYELCFLPFSLHIQTNVIYVALLFLLW